MTEPRTESSSGIVLLSAAAIALVWANSPWRRSYVAFWHLSSGLRFGSFGFERDLHFWVNDGLMTVFFFVVGLEIRREFHRGALSESRRAALPFVAAAGGMLAPAAIFIALNRGYSSLNGWGIPMATDIAFAVGVLALLGKRVSPALRILLLALAVIDDVGAIIVIAVFYSAHLSGVGFAILVFGLLVILGMQKLGVRTPWAYVLPASVAWAGAYIAGIHPTLAGVVVGLMTPVTAWVGPVTRGQREVVSPLDRIQHTLHPWVAFGIMPLFALANAGVEIGNVSLAADSMRVFAGVGLGLVLGKPLGILALTWISTRLGLTALPSGVGWAQVTVVGLVAGIGFTMALLIGELAFSEAPEFETAKLAVLAASAVAALLGLVTGVLVLEKDRSRTVRE